MLIFGVEVARDPPTGAVCDHLISPGLLKRCSLYRRNESHDPEKCWDRSAHPELPASTQLDCPNHTGHRSALRFTEEQRRIYPLFGTPKASRLHSDDYRGDSSPPELEDEEEAAP